MSRRTRLRELGQQLEEKKVALTANHTDGHPILGEKSHGDVGEIKQRTKQYESDRVLAAIDRKHEGRFGKCDGCDGDVLISRLVADICADMCIDCRRTLEARDEFAEEDEVELDFGGAERPEYTMSTTEANKLLGR